MIYYLVYNTTTGVFISGGHTKSEFITGLPAGTGWIESSSSDIALYVNKGYYDFNLNAQALYTQDELDDIAFAAANPGWEWQMPARTLYDGRGLSQAKTNRKKLLVDNAIRFRLEPYKVSTGPPLNAWVDYDGPFWRLGERELLSIVAISAERAKRTSNGSWSYTYVDIDTYVQTTFTADQLLDIVDNYQAYFKFIDDHVAQGHADIDAAATIAEVDAVPESGWI